MILGAVTPKNQKDLRSSLHPNTIKPILDMGIDIIFESGLGAGMDVNDEVLTRLGAKSVSREACLSKSDVLMSTSPIASNEISLMKDKALFLGLMEPFSNKEQFSAFQLNNISAVSMEFIPRITRAQKMDVLSSQSNVAGYVAVIESAKELKSALPMMMTAAGTLKPATVFVIGVGVAGLQAIATAKRLGEIVSATDVRAASKEQVESLGGKFLEVEGSKDMETSGGYAKETSDDYKKKQAEMMQSALKKNDIVICTALIPGKPAPRILTEDLVKLMKPGSIVYDLAAEQGGNSAFSEAGKINSVDGIKIIGVKSLMNSLPLTASSLYAKNLFSYIRNLYSKEKKDFNINLEDEIITKSLIREV